jgi:hypothetical protein
MSNTIVSQSQVEIMQGLNSALGRVLESVRRSTNAATSQIETITSLNQNLQQYEERSETFLGAINGFQRAYTELSQINFFPNQGVNNTLNSNVNQTQNAVQSLQQAQQQGPQNTQDQINSIAESADRVDQSTATITNTQRVANENSERAGLISRGFNNICETIREAASKTEISKGLASSGKFSLLITVPKLLFSVLSLLGGVVVQAVGIIAQATKTIMTLPFTLASIVIEPANAIRQKLVEGIGNAAEDFKEEFDFSSSIGKGAQKLQGTMSGSLKLFQDNKSKLSRLFGMDSPEAVMKAGQEMVSGLDHFSEVFGGSILGNIDNLTYMVQAQRALGITAKELKYYAMDAYTKGTDIKDSLTDTMSEISRSSKEFNQDRKGVSQTFHKLRLNIMEFGTLSNRELVNVSSRLRLLKISAEDAVGLFSKISTYDEAVNTSTQLFQSFGMVIDAYDLVSAKDPAEMVMMLRDGMLRTGKSFEMLNRHERQHLKNLTGLSDSVLATTFSYKNMSMSQEEIRNQMQENDPTQEQIETMRDLASGIREIKKTLQFKSPFEALYQGFIQNAGTQGEMIKASTELSETYESLNRSMRNLDGSKIDGFTIPLEIFLEDFTSLLFDGTLIDTFSKGIDALGNLLMGLSASGTEDKIDDAIFGFMTFNKQLKGSIDSNILNRLNEELEDIFLFGDNINKDLMKRLQKDGLMDKEGMLTDVGNIENLMSSLNKAYNEGDDNLKASVTKAIDALQEAQKEYVKKLSGDLKKELKTKLQESTTSSGSVRLLENSLSEMINGSGGLIGGMFNLGRNMAGFILKSIMQAATAFAMFLNGDIEGLATLFNATQSNTILDMMGLKGKEFEKLKSELISGLEKLAQQHGGKLFDVSGFVMGQLWKSFKFFVQTIASIVMISLKAAYSSLGGFRQTLVDIFLPEIGGKVKNQKQIEADAEAAVKAMSGEKDKDGNVTFSDANLKSVAELNEAFKEVGNLDFELKNDAEGSGAEITGGVAGVGAALSVGGAVGAKVAGLASWTGPIGLAAGVLAGLVAGGVAYYTASNTVKAVDEKLTDWDGYLAKANSIQRMYEFYNDAKSGSFMDTLSKTKDEGFKKIYSEMIDFKDTQLKSYVESFQNNYDMLKEKDSGTQKLTNNVFTTGLEQINSVKARMEAINNKNGKKVNDLTQSLNIRFHDNDKVELIASKQGGLLRELYGVIISKYRKVKNQVKVSLEKNRKSEYINSDEDDEILILEELVYLTNCYAEKLKEFKVNIKQKSLEVKY